MLFSEAFKAMEYQKVFALGRYTDNGGWTTIKYRIGKQNPSSMKIPTRLFNTLHVDDDDKHIIMPDWLTVKKDNDTGFKKLVYIPEDSADEHLGED